MNVKGKKKISAAATVLSVLFLMCTAGVSWGALPYEYQFEDIYGISAFGGQWIVHTEHTDATPETYPDNTRGAATNVDISPGRALSVDADLIVPHDMVYSQNGYTTSDNTVVPGGSDYIKKIFLAIPGTPTETETKLQLDFGYNGLGSYPNLSFDMILPAEYGVSSTVVRSGVGVSTIKDFVLDRTRSADLYDTVMAHVRFDQDPSGSPTHATNVPVIIARVASGDATRNPLTLRVALRERNATAASGDIVGYQQFDWNVAENRVEKGKDWIFVPLDNEGDLGNHAAIDYGIFTNIRNFSGIRYALDVYNGNNNNDLNTVHGAPSGWRMDLTAKDIADYFDRYEVKNRRDSLLPLHEKSHIAPGLLTFYEGTYNILRGNEKLFRIYPSSSSASSQEPHNVNLILRRIYGVDLGRNHTIANAKVNAFRIMQVRPSFFGTAAKSFGGSQMAMPQAGDLALNSAIDTKIWTADVIGPSLKINAEIPAGMQNVASTVNALPLYITLNLPHTNSVITDKWADLFTEWKKTGDIREMFASHFRLNFVNEKETGNSVSDENVIRVFEKLLDADMNKINEVTKVFLDEENDCITVSLMVTLVDSGVDGRRRYCYLDDDSGNSLNHYLFIEDGVASDKWGGHFYIDKNPTPLKLHYGSSNHGGNGGGDGGGGGCAAGALPLAGVLGALCCALGIRKRR